MRMDGQALPVLLAEINAPRPRPLDAEAFVSCLKATDSDPRFLPHMRALFEEIPIELLHNLVLDGVTDFDELAAAAETWGCADAESVAWIREMAAFRREMAAVGTRVDSGAAAERHSSSGRNTGPRR